MREAAKARLRKRASGTGIRATVNEQDAIRDLGVESDIGIPRSDAGEAGHGAETLIANLPCRAVRQFANIRCSRTYKNQIDVFASRRCVFHREGGLVEGARLWFNFQVQPCMCLKAPPWKLVPQANRGREARAVAESQALGRKGFQRRNSFIHSLGRCGFEMESAHDGVDT